MHEYCVTLSLMFKKGKTNDETKIYKGCRITDRAKICTLMDYENSKKIIQLKNNNACVTS